MDRMYMDKLTKICENESNLIHTHIVELEWLLSHSPMPELNNQGTRIINLLQRITRHVIINKI